MDNQPFDALIDEARGATRGSPEHSPGPSPDFPPYLLVDPADAAPGIPPWSSPYRLWRGFVEDPLRAAPRHHAIEPPEAVYGEAELDRTEVAEEIASERALAPPPEHTPMPQAPPPSAPWMPAPADLAWVPEPVPPSALLPNQNEPLQPVPDVTQVIAEPIGTSWPFAPTPVALTPPGPDAAWDGARFEAVPVPFQQPPTLVTLRAGDLAREPAILSADSFAKILMGDVSAPPTLDAEPVDMPPPRRYESLAPAADFAPPPPPGRPERTSRSFVRGARAPAPDMARLRPAIDAHGRDRSTRDNRWRWGRRTIFGVLVLGVPIAGAAFMLLPGSIFRPPADTAIFTAPTLVLRAAVAGRVTAVQATDGASLRPDTPLLTIHAEPPPDPAAAALRSRLAAAEARIDSLDSQLAQPAGAGDAAKARTADLRRLRLAATAERDQLAQAVSSTPSRETSDLVLRSRVRGFVRTVEVAVGTQTVPGSPLVQLIDCDRAFMVERDGPLKLAAGDRVQILIQGLPQFAGRVRPSAGVSEPPGSLVIEPIGLNAASAAACPLGAQAIVTMDPSS